MAWRQLCIWFVLLVQFQVYGSLGCLEEEHNALLQLKASFNYEYAIPPPLWDEKNCCDWKGVECSNTTGRVIQLSLSMVRYEHYLNASLFLPFMELRILDLSCNQLLGCVWNGGFERLSRLSKLESLFLDANYFNNTILPSLSTISTLKHISLSHNRLKGSEHIQGLCKLKSLQELEIQENELQGILPPCLIDLTFLHVLDISSNQFAVGSIALSPIANLTSLESLSFSANNFHSPIQFSTFANQSKLKKLAIDCDYNGTIVETEYPTWVPRFQLRSFIFSKCLANNLTPTSPSFLYSQYDLRDIVLFGNNLKGEFPTWLLENNTKLERIILRNNSFTGKLQLPQNLNMKSLDVSQNHFHDQIPDNIGTLFPNLRELNMSRNAFEGSIPSSFGDLSSLQRLDISNNNISGRIQANLVMGCSSLLFLKLSNNSLHGEIFPNSFNLSKLFILSLNDNHFIGEIPKGLSNCSNLGILDISNNRLSGSLPGWMGNMSRLRGIDMAKNNLEGSIPNDFCQLYLRFLNLADNDLSGSIPSCFSPPLLKYVNFHSNKLTGTLTYAFSKSLQLVTLDVRDNYLAGSIPNWISKLPKLSILLLKENNFQGSIPNDLCHSSNVKIMDLSRNYLSGPIPSCLNNITFSTAQAKEVDPLESKLTFLSLYDGERAFDFFTTLHEALTQVEFTTKNMYYPYQGDILKLMSGIDLSCNQLTGRIPPEIGNINQIYALNLSHNQLTGPIPATFSSLSQVESLDLSYNNLTGKIPSQLTRLSFLAVFSVAYNNLSGRAPDMIRQFATFKESSYEGNPLLCGPPLQKNFSIEETANGRTSVKEIKRWSY